jgi:hypothetical protein
MNASSHASAQPVAALRLLVLGAPGATVPPRWPAELAGACVVHAPDVFAAAAALANQAPFHAVVVDGAALPHRTLEALTLIRRHRPLAIWLLEPVPPVNGAALAALGAVPLQEALNRPWPVLPAAGIGRTGRGPAGVTERGEPAPEEDRAVRREPGLNGVQAGAAANGHRAGNRSGGPPSGELNVSRTAAAEVPADPSERYDELAEQPLLSAEELRALLGA